MYSKAINKYVNLDQYINIRQMHRAYAEGGAMKAARCCIASDVARVPEQIGLQENDQSAAKSFNFFEFFAGGGMARAGLGPRWACLFANDFDEKKALTYEDNWGADNVLRVCDVKAIDPSVLPGLADLAWASFPCQDLSLAGSGAGLKGERSGSFHSFWDIMRGLVSYGRGPKIIALENVCGLLTVRYGQDFNAICEAFAEAGYSCGALVIDASWFLPQSRPRLFIIGVRNDLSLPPASTSSAGVVPFHPPFLTSAYKNLSLQARKNWIWWNLPEPMQKTEIFADLIEDNPVDVSWFTKVDTDRLLASMSATNLAKVDLAKQAAGRVVGCVYKRTRQEGEERIVRAEVRFDDTAGCLRTLKGGSSRQIIMIVEGDIVRARLISGRETARLMGLDDQYKLPRKYSEACNLTGDGVAVPVVRYLAQHLMEPILRASLG